MATTSTTNDIPDANTTRIWPCVASSVQIMENSSEIPRPAERLLLFHPQQSRALATQAEWSRFAVVSRVLRIGDRLAPTTQQAKDTEPKCSVIHNTDETNEPVSTSQAGARIRRTRSTETPQIISPHCIYDTACLQRVSTRRAGEAIEQSEQKVKQ